LTRDLLFVQFSGWTRGYADKMLLSGRRWMILSEAGRTQHEIARCEWNERISAQLEVDERMETWNTDNAAHPDRHSVLKHMTADCSAMFSKWI
jgi:hypothetical protein